ncbi:Protein retinal degeneration B [Orchesella cincta]|uniref:Protein retinal degeneration B n=1 Tax=Orchesella cincta TaxID=48709 RepID=A0A1D2MX46_ORCCI|nr:Protein retinal degeneration B [Orchesella cincta]
MLIKEYRIPLPLTVEEYRIAQLYMIAKKSREETKGAGSGVEIMTNEPYEEGPGGSGQYTRKVYHVGSHLPGWFKSLLPKSALTVEEEAWNAYPYTKTRYTCPFVQRFSLEIETYYCADDGHQENVFTLSGSDKRNRVVDVIDVVKDQLHGADYLREEDPRVFMSQKTSRGPLTENWVEEYWSECKNKAMPTADGKAIMCAYKLCRVEFHYWGMQSKIEKFIHDVALRKTMLRAHRQAWAWQDEWHGLTMADIREIERETAEALKKKMAASEDTDNDLDDDKEEDGLGFARQSSTSSSIVGDVPQALSPSPSANSLAIAAAQQDRQEKNSATMVKPVPIQVQISDLSVPNPEYGDDNCTETITCFPPPEHGAKGHLSRVKNSNKASLNSPSSSSNKSFDLLASWRMEGIVRKDSDSEGSEDEFFDCLADNDDGVSLTKWSSLDLIPQDTDGGSSSETPKDDSIFSQPFLQKITAERKKSQKSLVTRGSMEASLPGSPTLFSSASSTCIGSCKTTVLCLVVHAGSALDAAMDLTAKKSDITTFKGAFESVIRQHYVSMMGHVVVKLVPCPSICTDALGILSSLSPYSFDVYGTGESPSLTHESVSIGAIPLISTAQQEYFDAVLKTVLAGNQVYQEFLRSEEGQGFSGQIIMIGDSMGSLLAYDALTRHSHSGQYANEDDAPSSPGHGFDGDHLHAGHIPSTSPRRRSSSSASDSGSAKLDFDVTDFFMFGSPLSLVLAQRKIHSEDRQMHLTRPCQQVFNLFHPTDPLATRLEPILSARFAAIAPVNVARYSRYPLGDGQPYHLHYALYCPEALAAFPVHSLPHLFHASYWESTDAIAFILRQIASPDGGVSVTQDDKEARVFIPSQPREKWIKKRTSVKLKVHGNVAANHRANDVIVAEGSPVVFKARFMYGPLDMVTLTGEKVDIYVMKDPPAGEWALIASEVTDKNGRVTHALSKDIPLGYGIYPLKMIVRGDHTCVDFYCAVVPPKTECVVFSIDGSFTASMSVTGRDPRVRAGAVDVVRHWQELGYLIIYVTGRPDMQQHKVVSWLAQHNFPHGLVSFADGLSTDFLGHKADYLKCLVQDHKLLIHAAYGSSKDINVYSSIGIPPEKIFIVGKVSKKQHALATVLCEGYSAHLSLLQAHGGSRPAQGNARMVIPRGCFGLPGQPITIRRRRSAKRTTSYPVMGQTPCNETMQLIAPNARGISPRRPKPTMSSFTN